MKTKQKILSLFLIFHKFAYKYNIIFEEHEWSDYRDRLLKILNKTQQPGETTINADLSGIRYAKLKGNKMEDQNDFTITIEDTEYKFSELSNENKATVMQLRDLEGQMRELNFKFEQLNASKTFFSQNLIANVKATKEEKEEKESK